MFSVAGCGTFMLSAMTDIMLICALLHVCYIAFGTIRNKKERLGVVVLIVAIISHTLVGSVHLNKIDIPGIFSSRYEEMEGIVCNYKIEVGKGGKSIADVEDYKTGRVTRFSYVDIPSELRIGDSVKIRYLKHNKMGAIAEINGKKITNYIYHFGEHSVGITLIVLLLLSMPFYYLWIYKVGPVINYKLTYAAYAYHDIYIKAMKILYLFMIQTAIVLIIAVRGNYKTSWDWYWGVLLIADHAGVFCLSFLRQKQFIIMKNKFYYCNFKKRVEGDLSEIESVEKTDSGVIIRTKEAEMEVLCTSKRYREALLDKLA